MANSRPNPDGSTTPKIIIDAWVPLGYVQIVSPAAAVGITPPAGATMALISVSGATMRWRDDGTAPTASVGMPVAAGQEFQYSGNLSKIQVIGSGATLDISFYQ